MFPIQCDHRTGLWPLSWQCRKHAVKHLLHHPANGYGRDPQVLLLCDKHFRTHLAEAWSVVDKANKRGNREMVLSNVVKDLGDI